PGLWVVTTEQIARAAPAIRVVLGDTSEVPARVVGVDSRLGIALLSVGDATAPTPASMPGPVALALGNSDDIHVGEWITAVGDPFGEGAMATVGTISSLGAAPGALATATGENDQATMPLGVALHNALGYRSFFVTDARIHRGNSGGAVLDTAGSVIGMAILPADGGSSNELAFIVPINRIKEVLAPLRERGTVTRAWLGALVQPVNPDQAATANLPTATGALVTEIKTGSPAAKSPLRVGDIILRWDDRSVDHRTLPYVVSASIPDKVVTVQIWRSGAATTISVAPEQMPE
ncbi:MAG: trypsin-like peptidase domain-containing protein, partial [Kofleriaceae bacterium]|nr:trypsin-like peptidase domain-containing protein [Kofleriaceae bacterium]